MSGGDLHGHAAQTRVPRDRRAGRPGDRRGDPRRDGDGRLRDGDPRLAHRDHTDPQPEQRAQRDDPRRARRARRALGRHPAVHAQLHAAGALRDRVLQGRGAERGRRAGRERSLSRRRTPARLQRVRTRGRRRRARADRVDPVSSRRHRRRYAGRLQRRGDRHLGRGCALPGREALRPRRRAPRHHLPAQGEQPHAHVHRRPARAGRR